MIRLTILGVFAFMVAAFAVSAHAQTATETPTPTMTVTATPTPTGAVQGTSTTVPSGAPATGHGGL
jgi:hypothetical protein